MTEEHVETMDSPGAESSLRDRQLIVPQIITDVNTEHTNYNSRWHNVSCWIKKGIFFINDFINDDGNFLSFENFQNKFNVHTNFLIFNGLISAIPKHWKELIKDVPREEICDGNIEKLNNAKSIKDQSVFTLYFYHLSLRPL